MKPRLIFLSSALCLVCASATYSQQTISGFEAPESVIRTGDKIFVSNIGGEKPNPMALDSNGFISELSSDGKTIHHKFQKTILNAPKGLAVVKDVIYVADVNRVVGFNMHSGDQVFELGIKATMLNDLCKVDDKHIAVSETVTGQVFLIDVEAKSTRFLGTVDGANGVTFDEKRGLLYVAGMGVNMSGGKIFSKELKSQDTVFTALPNSPTGIFDGLEMTDNNHLLMSDWISFTSKKGRLVLYDLEKKSSISYDVDAGPADIYYDKSAKTVYIPQMMKNSLLIENMKSLQAQ